MELGAIREQIKQNIRGRAGHSLIVGAARRYGKRRVSEELAEERAMEGNHVHLGSEICYNGDEFCAKYVEKRLEWIGHEFVSAGPASGGENGDK